MISWPDKTQKAIALNNSRPLNASRNYKLAKLVKASKALFQRVAAMTPGIKGYKEQYIHHINVFVTDLYLLAKCSKEQFLAYYRYSGKYDKGEDLHKLGLRHSGVINTVDALIAIGFAEGEKGNYDRSEKIGHCSRLRATKALVDYLENEFGFAPYDFENKLLRKAIILRDKDKKAIPFTKTKDIMQMLGNMLEINSLLRKTKVFPAVKDKELDKIREEITPADESHPRALDYTSTQVRRVFNNSKWEDGGRFYGGWWLRVPKEYRRNITINDELTVEIDYKAYHIKMLYALEGIPFSGDPYVVGPHTTKAERKFLKTALLTIINAANKHKAHQSLYDQLKKGALGTLPGIHTGNFRELVDDFCDRHKPIMKHFFTGVGVKLQNYDSKIAEEILLRFTRKGIPVLPVHDSFIISHKHAAELEIVMLDCFQRWFKFPGEVEVEGSFLNDLRTAYGSDAKLAEVGFTNFINSIPGLGDDYKSYLAWFNVTGR